MGKIKNQILYLFLKNFKKTGLLGLIVLPLAFMPDNFKTQQLKFPHVKTSFDEKESVVKKLFKENNIDISSMNIFFRVFKKEAKFEVWATSVPHGCIHTNQQKYKLLKTYTICSSSGTLGPKRKQGDMQVPEGFYEISHFNPYSNFYLSLGVSYPNASDRILGGKGDLGGSIYVHGNCVTIGCMPITDDKIKEVYVMAVEAKSNGQKTIPIYIFPCVMNAEGMKFLETEYPSSYGLISFWKNIQKGYEYFEKNKTLPSVSVLNNGKYSFF